MSPRSFPEIGITKLILKIVKLLSSLLEVFFIKPIWKGTICLKIGKKIVKLSLEIKTIKEIQEYNDKYINDKYKKDRSFETVRSMLEIEKCKVLDEYNNNKYEINKKSIEQELSYNKMNFSNQNRQFEAEEKIKIDINEEQSKKTYYKIIYDYQTSLEKIKITNESRYILFNGNIFLRRFSFL